MPLVYGSPKFKFSTLKLRAKLIILSSLIITLTLSAYAGWLFYSSVQQSREKRAYADAMTQADNFSKNNKPHQAVAVLEAYLKSNPPLDHRYHAMSTLAFAYIQNRDNDKAIAELKATDALNYNPPSIYVLRSLAYYYLTHNDKPKAIGYYKRAVAVAESKYDPEATPYIDSWKAQINQLKSVQ